jgi:alpha-1,3-rhamnosyl/mannosyltransferase
MRVGYDVAPLVLDNAGTARYVRGVLGALRAREDVDVHELTWGGSGRLTAAVRDVAWYPFGLPLSARRLDVLHCTTFRAPLRSSVPVIATVHDLAVVRHPELFTTWTRTYARTLLLPVLRAARRVLAVSERTKRDVVELARVPPERVDVAYNAADTAVFTPEGAAADGDYVLAVGTLEPRKNLERLIAAWGRLPPALQDSHTLALVGPRGWDDAPILSAARAAGAQLLGGVTDDELRALYAGAAAFVYPSLYEGFGLPVLEAMAAGAPVITSNVSSLPEVAGDAALLVDPRDEAAIAEAIERVVTDPTLADDLRARGRPRAAAFSWARTARETLAVLSGLADGVRGQ